MRQLILALGGSVKNKKLIWQKLIRITKTFLDYLLVNFSQKERKRYVLKDMVLPIWHKQKKTAVKKYLLMYIPK